MIKYGSGGIPFLPGECSFQSINHKTAETITCYICGWGDFTVACRQNEKVPNLSLFFSQSLSLSVSPVWTARFSQEPADQSVVRGQRVILSCVVFNYSGIVQWTKDGLALGIGEDLQGETSYSLFRRPPLCSTCD